MDDRLRLRLVFLRLALPLMACCWLLAAGGCTSFDLSKNIPWGSGKDGAFSRPMKIIAVWQNTVMHQEGMPAVRGFGGRLWFYGPDEEKPVLVDGTLEVYAFEETDGDAPNFSPDRKYVFTSDDVKRHHSEGKLGDSYSFWLPWGDVDGPTLEVSLIARFTPVDGGGMIRGEETKHELPGREPPKAKKRKGLHSPGQAPTWQSQGSSPGRPASMDQEPRANPEEYGHFEPANPATNMVVPAAAAIPQGSPPSQAEQAPRLRVTTLSVSNRPGGASPYTTSTIVPGMGLGGAAEAWPAGQTAIRPQTPQPLGVGYLPGPRRVLGGPIERLNRERDPRRPNPARWQYGPAQPPVAATPPAPN